MRADVVQLMRALVCNNTPSCGSSGLQGAKKDCAKVTRDRAAAGVSTVVAANAEPAPPALGAVAAADLLLNAVSAAAASAKMVSIPAARASSVLPSASKQTVATTQEQCEC